MAAREVAGDGATEVPGAGPHLEHHGRVDEMGPVAQGLGREDEPAQGREEEPGGLVWEYPGPGQPPDQGCAFPQASSPCASSAAMSARDPSTVPLEQFGEGNKIGVGGMDRDEFREGSPAGEPGLSLLRADVRLALRALLALSTPAGERDCHPIGDVPSRHA